MLRLLRPNIPENGEEDAPQTILLLRNQSTLIGSHPDCDIRIKCPGVRPRHALIEFCPKSGTFWLRQLSPFEEQRLREFGGRRRQRNGQQMAADESSTMPPPPPYPYEEADDHQEAEEVEFEEGETELEEDGASRKHTREQVLQDGTMVQLRQSDTLRFGSGPAAVEFAFKMPPIGGGPERIVVKKRTGSYGGTFGRKDGPSGHKGCGGCSLQSADGLSLPIVGSRIQPRAHADRFARPRPAARLCHRQHQGHAQHPQNAAAASFQRLPDGVSMLRRSHSASRIIAIGESSDGAEESGEWRAKKRGPRQTGMVASTGGSMDSMADEAVFIDNSLMAPIAVHSSLPPLHHGANGGLPNAMNKRRNVQNVEWLHGELGGGTNEEGGENGEGMSKLLAPPHAHLNEIVYDTFFRVCTEEMDALNKKLSILPIRDYADIFAEMHKILHEPFSFRLMEVNSKCSLLFESLKPALKPSDREQLYVQFDHFLKQKVFPISKPIDSFLSTLRESASMARESARACGVFSQWSREFGDQLQLQPNWDLMLYKVRDLQTRFREHGLPKHWLPPSLMPLLEVLIFERKNWAEEKQKREEELAQGLAKAQQKIAELEAQLEKRPPAPEAPQNALPPIPRIELHAAAKKVGEGRESSEGGEEATKAKDGGRSKSPRTPRSVRSARSSIGSLKLGPFAEGVKGADEGLSEDEEEDDSRHAGDVEHINSPRTPPPSKRGRGTRNGGEEEKEGKMGAELEGEGGQEEIEIEPLGDGKEEREKEGENEEAENVGKEENLEGEKEGGELLEGGGDLDSGRPTTARAIRTALAHLNEVYDELRAKSRAASPAADGEEEKNAIGAKMERSKSAHERRRRQHSFGGEGEEEEHEGGSDRTDSNESLVKPESESEDEHQGQTALLHLYSYYRDLEEQRRKSQSTVDGGDDAGEEGEELEEKEEMGEGREEEGKGEGVLAASEGQIVEGDDVDEGQQKERQEKIARAEKAILLGGNRAPSMEATLLEETPKTAEKASKMDESSLDGEQREFERIEQEILEGARMEPNEEEGKGNGGENAIGNGNGGRERQRATEFWQLASRLAEMLNLDLSTPPSSSSRNAHSADANEVEARQKAVDSIMDRLEQILTELKEAQQQQKGGESLKRRRWMDRAAAKGTTEEEEGEEEEAGESAI